VYTATTSCGELIKTLSASTEKVGVPIKIMRFDFDVEDIREL
jgi:hypothetical protein